MRRFLPTAFLAALALVNATSPSGAVNLTIPAESLYAAQAPIDWPTQPCLRCVPSLETGRSAAVVPFQPRRPHRVW